MYNMFIHCNKFLFTQQSQAHNLLQSYLLEQNAVFCACWLQLSVHKAQRFNFFSSVFHLRSVCSTCLWSLLANASTFQYKVMEEKTPTLAYKHNVVFNSVLHVMQHKDNQSGKTRKDMHF